MRASRSVVGDRRGLQMSLYIPNPRVFASPRRSITYPIRNAVKCNSASPLPSVSGVYADAVASSKFEVGVGGRWISLGVIAKAEAYPFLSAVTPQKNKTHVCASTACWITTSTKTTSKPISEADVCSCFCKLFWGGEGVERGTAQTKERDAGWKKKY